MAKLREPKPDPSKPPALRVFPPMRRPDRLGLLLWLNTTMNLRARLERGVAREDLTVTPEDTLRAAGMSSKRQAQYQRRMSKLLAGRSSPRMKQSPLE